MKGYIITARCDASNAPRHNAGREATITFDGWTTVEWIRDSNLGRGYSLAEARRVLHGYAREDALRTGEPNGHRFFALSYESDSVTYEAIPVECWEVEGRRMVFYAPGCPEAWGWTYGHSRSVDYGELSPNDFRAFGCAVK